MSSPKYANRFLFVLYIFLIFLPFTRFILNIESETISKYFWVVQSIYSILCFMIPIFLFMFIAKVKFKDIIPLAPLKIKNFFLIIFLGFAMQPMLDLIANITNLFYKDEVSGFVLSFTNLNYFVSLFTLAVVPAIVEELAFRGIILSSYKNNPVLTGVLMSSFYFGIMHLTITQFFYAIAGGILFSLLVKVTKSIYSSILIHFIFNGTQITIAYIVSKFTHNIDISMVNNINDFQNIFFSLIRFIATLPFLILSIFLFIIFNINEIRDLMEENKKIKLENNKEKIFTPFFFINVIIWVLFISLNVINNNS